jgi:hypothetical protein
MPLEVMQMLIQRHHPETVTLWTEEFGTPGVLWLSRASGLANPRTMALARSVSAGSHFGLSRKHFFQLSAPATTIDLLVDAMHHATPGVSRELEGCSWYGLLRI